MEEDSFIKFLKKYKKQTYFLVTAPGNSGDILLRKGLELYFENNKYKIINEVEKADNILINGGGNIDDVWYCGIKLFKNMAEKYPNKKIVVAPSTCHFSKTNFEEILNNCKQEIHFFTRENNSFTRLKNMKLNKNIHIYKANDTAFLLEKSDYLSSIKKKSKDRYILFSFRTNRESRLLNKKIIGLIKNSFEKFSMFEISNWVRYKYTMWAIKNFIKKNIKQYYNKAKIITDASYKDYFTFINLISNASEIYTDRLHVGILGAMLGKKVYLYKTRYDKVQGVYEQTLHSYPNVIKMF